MNTTDTKRIYFGELRADHAELIDGEDYSVDYGPFYRISAGIAVVVQDPAGLDEYHGWRGGLNFNETTQTSLDGRAGKVNYTIGAAGELAIIHEIHQAVSTFEEVLNESSTLRVYAPGAWLQVTGTRHEDPHYATGTPKS